jgi:hypothetical protein
MERQRAFYLRALNSTPFCTLTNITSLFPPPLGNLGAINLLSAFRVLKEHLRNIKRAHNMGPPAISGCLHCSTFARTEAARMGLIGLRRHRGTRALGTEPITLWDTLYKGIAIAGGVNHYITPITEHNWI